MPSRGAIAARLAVSLVALSAAGCAHRSLDPADYRSTGMDDFMGRYAAPDSARAPGALNVTYLGTTSLLLDDGVDQILIDGFLSRPGVGQLLGRELKSDMRRIRAALRTAEGDRIRAVFVAHSHYDHALDSAVVARLADADLYGSPSTLNLGHGERLPIERLLPLREGVETRVGSFSVTPLAGAHSPVSVYNDNLGEQIAEPRPQPVHASRLVEGGSFDFLIRHGDRTMLVMPAAGYEAGARHGVCADVLFLAVGVLGNQDAAFRRAFYLETVRRVRPRLVVPMHWDSPFRELSSNLRGTPFVLDDVRRGLKTVTEAAVSDGIEVVMLDGFERIALDGWFSTPGDPDRLGLDGRGACARSGGRSAR